MNFSLERVAANRNFCNKIWNAARFVVANVDLNTPANATLNLAQLTVPDRWILGRVNQVTAEVTRLIEDYNFGEAGRQLYDFFWSEFADWYIEISKIGLQSPLAHVRKTTQQILVHVLEKTLRLLHPYIPFITEAAWLHLPHQGSSLMVASWPKSYGRLDETVNGHMAILMEVIRTIRNIRSEYNVEPAKWISAMVVAGDNYALLQRHREVIVKLARLDDQAFNLVTQLETKPTHSAAQVIGSGLEIYLPLAGMIDLTAERARLNKELANLEKRILSGQAKLSNESFVSKAPAAVVAKERETLADMGLQVTKLQAQLAQLG
jgi:valyl-tRNA synthetase